MEWQVSSRKAMGHRNTVVAGNEWVALSSLVTRSRSLKLVMTWLSSLVGQLADQAAK